MLMHSFTKREKIVLAVVAVVLLIGLYFWQIHYPVKTRLEEIEAEKLTVEDETSLATMMATQYQMMKEELDEIFALPEDQISVMPEFDNKENLTFIFDSVFADTAPDLRFDAVRIEGNIAMRSISFSFSADSWAAAKEILTLLTTTGYRCQLQNLSLSPEGGSVADSPLRVSGNIVFYELVGGGESAES